MIIETYWMDDDNDLYTIEDRIIDNSLELSVEFIYYLSVIAVILWFSHHDAIGIFNNK